MTIDYCVEDQLFEDIEVEITTKIIADQLFNKETFKDKIAKEYIYTTINEMWFNGYLDYLYEFDDFRKYIVELAEMGEFQKNNFNEI
jgi:hypothetical protein